MMGLAKGWSVVFAAGWMVSDSSTLSVDLKQQRTLNPAQTKRLNVTLIWRLSRIFLKFVDLKDLKSFCREEGILLRGKSKTPETFGAADISNEQSSGGCQFIRHITDQGSDVAVAPHLVTATAEPDTRQLTLMYSRNSN